MLKRPIRLIERPQPVGYVVRYDQGNRSFSPPLSYHREGSDTDRALWYHVNGTVFTTITDAQRAISASRTYQRRRLFDWEMLSGPYVIQPIFA
jgi:hypothetical protein